MIPYNMVYRKKIIIIIIKTWTLQTNRPQPLQPDEFEAAIGNWQPYQLRASTTTVFNGWVSLGGPCGGFLRGTPSVIIHFERWDFLNQPFLWDPKKAMVSPPCSTPLQHIFERSLEIDHAWGTPSHHPFRTMGFPLTKTILWGYPHFRKPENIYGFVGKWRTCGLSAIASGERLKGARGKSAG